MRLWGWGQVGVQGLAHEADTGAGGADTEIFRIPRAERCTDGGRHRKKLSRLGGLGLN